MIARTSQSQYLGLPVNHLLCLIIIYSEKLHEAYILPMLFSRSHYIHLLSQLLTSDGTF
jgi:hypothetical protein